MPGSIAAGYALYYGLASHSYSNRIDAGTNTQISVTGLTEGKTYYFAVDAYNSTRAESPLSSEISFLVPGLLVITNSAQALTPVTLRFPVAPGNWYQIQASVDLKSWQVIWQSTTASVNLWAQFMDADKAQYPQRFYRLASYRTSVSPPPTIHLKGAFPTSLRFALDTAPGQLYQLQYSTNLASPNWVNWGSPLIASGSSISAADDITQAPQKFYRAILAGPLAVTPSQSSNFNGVIDISWNAISGQAYQIQFTTNATAGEWQDWGGGTIIANGSDEELAVDVGTTNQVQFRVLPGATLTQPVLSSVISSNGYISFNWNSSPGSAYQVQYCASLQMPLWQNLGSVVIASNSVTTWSDQIGPDPQRFYRVAMSAEAPPPVIDQASIYEGGILFTWNSVMGRSYQVQYCTDLLHPVWTSLSGNITAQAATMSAWDPILLDTQRFYRVVLTPQ